VYGICAGCALNSVYRGLLLDLKDPCILEDRELFHILLGLSFEWLDLSPIDVLDFVGRHVWSEVMAWLDGLNIGSQKSRYKVLFYIKELCLEKLEESCKG